MVIPTSLTTGASRLSSMPIQPGEIRLFLLQGCVAHGDPIRGRMGVFPLRQCPAFQALSYVWGERTEGRTIEVEGQGTVKVTDNLFAALRRLRLDVLYSRILWIDALCIDQDNVQERNAQVLFMCEIYARASVVMIWLGEPVEEQHELVGKAIKLVKDIVETAKQFNVPLCTDRDIWRCLNNTILGAAWFDRAWTFQEVIMAAKAVVMCGSHQFPWLDVLAFTDALAGPSKVIAPLARWDKAQAFGQAASQRYESEGIQLETLMFARRCCGATDPKDLVFAHLGITNEGQQRLLPVDYAMSIEQVYAETTKLLIRQARGLDVLTAVYHADRKLGMPSWTVDWRIPSEYNPIATLLVKRRDGSFVGLNKPNYNACKSQPLNERSLSWDVLELMGRRGPRISKIFVPCFEWESEGLPRACADWFSELAESRRLDETYLDSNDTYLDAFSRTLIADQDKCTSWTDHRADSEIRSTLAFVHRHPDLQGWTFSAVLKESEWDGKPKKRISIYLHMVRKLCANRRLFLSENGYIGLAPWEARVGDEVCVLCGGEVPFILRPQGDYHELVGEAYCDGYMDGEALADTSLLDSIKLR